MAGLSDILTSAQNIASALSTLAQTFLNVQGSQNLAGIAAATLVQSGPGRIAVVSVTTAATATGAIYDANAASATTNLIYTIPKTVGVYIVNFPLSFGLVVAPGAGMTVSVSYSGPAK